MANERAIQSKTFSVDEEGAFTIGNEHIQIYLGQGWSWGGQEYFAKEPDLDRMTLKVEKGFCLI